MCGAAKTCITPSAELLPNLHGLQNRWFGGVLDDIYCRAIALDNGTSRALLISMELDKIPYPERMMTAITDATGIPEELVTIVAVHTHSAPVTGHRPDEGPNFLDRKPRQVQKAAHEYGDFLISQLLSAVTAALDRLRPARMGIGTGQSYINVYRNTWYDRKNEDGSVTRLLALGADPSRPIDHTITALKFETPDGHPIAYFINYPVHCCVLHTNRLCDGKFGLSGDIAGFVSRHLEQEEDCVAIWSSGAAGDINPSSMLEVYYPDPDTGDVVTRSLDGDYGLLESIASRHLADVKKVLRTIVCDRTALPLAGQVEWSETPGLQPEKPYQVRLHLLRLNDILLFGASGEFYSSFGKLIRDLLPADHVIVMNHESSLYAQSGYIADDETLLLPDTDLPGISHTNMKPGYFRESLIRLCMKMYQDVS